MRNEERAAEIKEEIARLKKELKEVSGECQLKLKNRRSISYPYVFKGIHDIHAEVWESALDIEKLSSIVKFVLVPEAKILENGRMRTVAKKVKDFSPEEYAVVCACVDEMAEVLNRHNQKLHPNGIAVGRYVLGQDLYK